MDKKKIQFFHEGVIVVFLMDVVSWSVYDNKI